MDTVFFFFLKQFSYIIFEGETKIHSYVWKAMSIKKSQPNTVKSQSSPIKINDFTVSFYALFGDPNVQFVLFL